ncbi:MAG: NAD-dependent DNA ligase LigA, partial [Bacteroidia bacterium]|nr:NAD-dependent DNA ligase LigA [Bacteroidia bacterium]NNJ56129.1 NAD-dependent DNA ligase LigA [Bacteroidia bacterium]
MSTESKIKQLTEELKQHNYNYYVLAQPIISDREFDQKLKDLEKLEEAFPQYADPNSPTKQVGGDITKDFETVEHSVRMLSLGNTYSKEELLDFDVRVKKLIGGIPFKYTAELKFDGFAIALRYKHGKLIQAITRGDGTKGDDVTANVKTVKSIPHHLNGNYPENVEVRGEMFIHKAAFDRMNKERASNGEDLYKNPRNTAAGTIKLQDSAEVAKRPLDAFLYQLVEHGNEQLDHFDSLQRMKEYGLPVNDATKLCSTIEDVWKFIKYWDSERKNLSFEIDGVVIKVNSRLQQEELGFTSKFPRWAMSYKFETERAESKLLSISYQVGRTGAVTPVANLEPVQLLGTTVQRASLHNADFIADLDVRVGDVVYVEKGGEIIPKIVAVDSSHRDVNSKPTQFATHCPECQTLLERSEGEAAYR